MRLDIMTGFLLGDGCIIYPSKTSKTPRFEMKRALRHEDYILWMIENSGLEFSEIRRFSAPYKTGGKEYDRIRVQSRCSAELVPLQSTWYRDKKRILPREFIEKYFNEVSLAVWYMDDGSCTPVESSIRTRYNIQIATQAYGYEDLEWMTYFVYRKFGVLFNIDSYCRLRLGRQDEIDLLFKLVRPTVQNIPSMLYKIH